MKLVFDECMPRKWCQRFAALLRARNEPKIEATHLLDQMPSGTPDDEFADWLSRNAADAVMLSGDSGRHTKNGDPRLPTLLPQIGVRSIFISPKLCQRDGFEKVRMMMVCLPDIIDILGKPVQRYRLSVTPGGRLYHIKPWDLQPIETSNG